MNNELLNRLECYELLLFDCDGTIFDFQHAQHDAIMQMSAEKGFSASEKDVELFDNINTVLWQEYERGETTKQDLRTRRFRIFFERLGLKLDADECNKRYMELQSSSTYTIPGSIEFCRKVSQNHRMAIVTNSFVKTACSRFKGLELDGIFQHLITSEEAQSAKPQKSFFDYAFLKIGDVDKTKTAIIGDSLSADIKGGNNVGIDTYWYNPKQIRNEVSVDVTYEFYDWI